ncbi:uncharacterized protein [Euphorbia lathyris]|uniref:uncharacterized protein n=1 Tax=Euphorbia lathyris TaxID=212925 RepID=UPI0033134DD8
MAFNSLFRRVGGSILPYEYGIRRSVRSRFCSGGAEVDSIPNGFYLSDLVLERKYKDEEINVHIYQFFMDEMWIDFKSYKGNVLLDSELNAFPDRDIEVQNTYWFDRDIGGDEPLLYTPLPRIHFEKRGINSTLTYLIFNHIKSYPNYI